MPSMNMRASAIVPSTMRTARTSPMPCSMSQSGKRISRRLQKIAGFRQRQANHIGIAARDAPDIDFAIALERIAASLALPLAMACVEIDFVVRQALHHDLGLDQAFTHGAAGNGQ